MKRKVLILGAQGMLGHKLYQVLGAAECFEVYATTRGWAGDAEKPTSVYEGVDVLQFETVKKVVEIVLPTVIINAVGIVKQIEQASNRYISVAVNSLLPHKLEQLAGSIDAKLIHISTDCVFDGNKGNYTEDSPSDAEDIYGKSKFLGETDSTEKGAVTLRTSIVGHELQRHTSLLNWFIKGKHAEIDGYLNHYYTGVTTVELGKILREHMDEIVKLSGVYHVAGPKISKHDLLQIIGNKYSIKTKINPKSVKLCDRSIIMKKFSEETGYRGTSWAKMIDELYEDYQVNMEAYRKTKEEA